MAFPWIKFFPGGYLSDTRLRLESLEVQGFWLNLMCIMHNDGDPYGHLALNGEPISCEKLAVLLGIKDVPKVEVLLKHVAKAQLFGETRNGILFSRRLLKAVDIRKAKSKAGKKGGEATQKKILLKQTIQAKPSSSSSSSSSSKSSLVKVSQSSDADAEKILDLWDARFGTKDTRVPAKVFVLERLGAKKQRKRCPVALLTKAEMLEAVERYAKTNPNYPYALRNFFNSEHGYVMGFLEDKSTPVEAANVKTKEKKTFAQMLAETPDDIPDWIDKYDEDGEAIGAFQIGMFLRRVELTIKIDSDEEPAEYERILDNREEEVLELYEMLRVRAQNEAKA